jgi:hypothetical protein
MHTGHEAGLMRADPDQLGQMLACGKYDWQRPTSQDTVKVSRVAQICIYINEIEIDGMNIGSLLGSATHLEP